jgi:very-short-patch-repair endonuclease
MPVDSPDRRVVALAAAQHGVATTALLREAGLSRHAVAHRVARGWLRRLHHGVYLVGALEGPWSRAMAAVLAYGDGALLSHQPAAVLWGSHPPPAGAMHVTVVARDARGRDGIRAHTVARLHPADTTHRLGIPVTSAARTLVDLATQATQRDLSRAVDEARVLRLVTDHSLNEQLRRYPAHRGTCALKNAITSEPRLTRSEAERRLLELIRAAHLSEPQTNAALAGHEVDFLWPSHRLVVEVDGYAFHSKRSSFERDRRRDAALTLAGCRVIRITWRQITEQPELVIATLAGGLAGQPEALRSSTVSA